MFRSILTISLTAALASVSTAQNAADLTVSKGYAIDVCVVTGRPLVPAETHTVRAGGRTFNVCTEGCTLAVKAAPEVFGANLDTAVIASQKPTYPLDVCAVSGKKLTQFAEPVEFVLDGHLVIVGSRELAAKAKADQILPRLAAAVRATQSKGYDQEACLVTGAALGADALDVVHGTTLVRLADVRSLKAFERSPGQFLRKLGRGLAAGSIKSSGCCGACMADAPAAKPDCDMAVGAEMDCCEEKAAKAAKQDCCKEKAAKAAKPNSEPVKGAMQDCCKEKAAKAAAAKPAKMDCCKDK